MHLQVSGLMGKVCWVVCLTLMDNRKIMQHITFTHFFFNKMKYDIFNYNAYQSRSVLSQVVLAV